MEATRKHRTAIAVAVAIIAVAASAAALLPVRATLAAFAGWGRGAGAAGVLGFAAAQVACTLLLVPAWPLRVAAGFVWGFAGGFALAMPTSLAGSVLAFVLARRVLREPALAAIDAAVGARGFRAVLLLRLSPVLPNEAVNYALGASRVRLRDYVLASALGMVPTVASAVAAGSLVTAAADLALARRGLGAPAQVALAAVGVAATAAVVLGAVRAARSAVPRAARAVAAPPREA